MVCFCTAVRLSPATAGKSPQSKPSFLHLQVGSASQSKTIMYIYGFQVVLLEEVRRAREGQHVVHFQASDRSGLGPIGEHWAQWKMTEDASLGFSHLSG